MPVSTGAACLVNNSCPITPMPVRPASCGLDFIYGGVNDIYFIPCTETLSEANILDVDWWDGLKGDPDASPAVPNLLGSIGLGIGSIAKQTDRREKVASCRAEQVTSTTWSLTYTIKVWDKTAADTTKTQVDAILKRFQNFQAVARMCDGDNTVLPIGTFSVGDFNWTVPESSEELQTISFRLDWIEFGIPKTYNVVGLSAVVPKA